MISGIVADGHPIITVPFRIPNRADFPIEFVVDTGFTDELCLPPEAVALLNLPFRYDMRANLADNSRVMLPLSSQSNYYLEWRGAKGSCVCDRATTSSWNCFVR